jgi:uncharacterized membrane protein YsdA (DUF1294 family)
MHSAAIALFILNAWTMLRFWQDKQRAIAKQRRIPEADLLRLALIGGSPGALLARHLFRHKTSKQPFSTRLFMIVALQLAVIGYFLAHQPWVDLPSI